MGHQPLMPGLKEQSCLLGCLSASGWTDFARIRLGMDGVRPPAHTAVSCSQEPVPQSGQVYEQLSCSLAGIMAHTYRACTAAVAYSSSEYTGSTYSAYSYYTSSSTHSGRALATLAARTCPALGSDNWDHASLSAFSFPLAL